MKPIGLEHQEKDFSVAKIQHEFIMEHQKLFPELIEKMKYNSNASNVYSAFLIMIPFIMKGKLTAPLKHKIMKKYKLI